MSECFLEYYDSPLGRITMASDGQALIGLWFDGQRYDRAILKNMILTEKKLPVFETTEQWLDTYFAGEIPGSIPPIHISGSPFRQLISQLMLEIPYGQTSTYKEIGEKAAQILGKPRMSAQAVGGAVGHNSLSLIVPCHRVLGSDGSLTGYAGGIEKKQWLLALESRKMEEEK